MKFDNNKYKQFIEKYNEYWSLDHIKQLEESGDMAKAHPDNYKELNNNKMTEARQKATSEIALRFASGKILRTLKDAAKFKSSKPMVILRLKSLNIKMKSENNIEPGLIEQLDISRKQYITSAINIINEVMLDD